MLFRNVRFILGRLRHSRLVENILSLSVLQLLNLALPLLVLPYLIKTVGNSNYGAYAVAYSMVQYVVLISAYGFGFTVTKQISQNKDSPEIVSRIFHSTILGRLLLAVLSALPFCLISYFSFGYEYLILMLLGMGIVIGDIFNPVWLYQGMENMKYMTIVNFSCKLITTLLIFVFIRSQSDYQYIIAMDSVGYLSAGIFSYILAIRLFNIKILRSKRSDVLFQLKEGWYIFISSIFMTLYRNSNVFLLKFFLDNSAVGVYAASEKIIKAGQAIASPVSTALFPNLAAAFKKHTHEENLRIIGKAVGVFSIFLTLIMFGVFIFANQINNILLDGDSGGTVYLIRIMSPVIIFGGVNYILGIVGLVNLGKQKLFFKNVIVSGIISVVFLLSTVHIWGNVSAGISMVLAEVLLCMMCVKSVFYSK